jgi:hypothetical protein
MEEIDEPETQECLGGVALFRIYNMVSRKTKKKYPMVC